MPFSTPRYPGVAALVSCALLFTSPLCLAQGYKHLAVAPEAMAEQQLQAAESLGVFSHSTLAPVASLGRQALRIDTRAETPIMLLGPQVDQLRVQLTDPDGRSRLNETQEGPLASEAVNLGEARVPGKTLARVAEKPGVWQLSLTAAEPGTTRLSGRHYALVKGDPDFKLYSYRSTSSTLQDSEVYLVAQMIDATDARRQKAGARRRALLAQAPVLATVETAELTLTLPTGEVQQLRLNDEGRDGDAQAQDGRFTVRLPTALLGTYTQELQVSGTRPDGLPFSRTSMDLYPVVARDFQLTGGPAELEVGERDSRLRIPVLASGNSREVFVAAELWGHDARGRAQPLTWVGGIANPEGSADARLSLVLDSRWLADSRPPYELRQLRLQHVDNHTPLASQARLALELNARADRLAAANPASDTGPADKRLRIVGAPALRPAAGSQASLAGGVLMLVHGYCSGGAWNTGHFSNAVEFRDYNANRSHDSFARRIRDFGAGYSSFGVVAHSQGGAAALHLYAKYVSGLDNASGGRLIQSVGTPYQGTALAGNLAVLGQVFGAGCGTNTDLTYSGAANWLATIPGWARAAVDYYTTSFSDRWWAYDYCHLATDLLLDDPDDGTTEKWSGQLSGAVNKGHKTGWCHTGGMRDPAQTRDTSRNSSMSSRAAR